MKAIPIWKNKKQKKEAGGEGVGIERGVIDAFLHFISEYLWTVCQILGQPLGWVVLALRERPTD